MPELDVITLSRNEVHLRNLSEALGRQQGAPEYELFLVNNGGPEVQDEAIRQGWAGCTPGYNTTFSEGNNLAVADHTKAPWLLLLNDDVRPHQTMLAELWNARGRADVVGALLLHGDGTVNHAGTSVAVSACRTDHIGRGAHRAGFAGFAITPSVTFAAALVRRELWQRLRGLDEGYIYGWEDTDFCLRAIDAGATIGCARDAVGTHDECGTRPRGGQRDVANYFRFRDRWEKRLPELLERYRAAHPDVEGIT